MNVLGLTCRSCRPFLYVPIPLAVSTHGLGRLDDLDIKTRAKGCDVGHGEVVLAWVGLGRQRGLVAELGEAESGQDGDDIGVVAEVEVEGLVKREGRRVGVERGVDLRARVAQSMVLEAGDDFLLVANTYGPPSLGLPAAVTREEEIYALLVRKATRSSKS